MKKTKKLAALFLAMVMAFSLMAVTAAAYGAEEHVHDETCYAETIQPRKPTGPACPYCAQTMDFAYVARVGDDYYDVYKCCADVCSHRGYTVYVKQQ